MSRPGHLVGARRAAGAFLVRDFQVGISYRLPFLIQILGTFFSVVTMWFVAKIVDPSLIPGGYFTFVVLGLALTAFLYAGVISIGSNLREEQLLGTLEATLGSGIPVGALAVGMAAYPMINAVFSAVVYLGLAVPLGLRAPGANWSLALVTVTIGAVAFVGIGLIGAAIVLVIRKAAGAIAWIVAALTMAAGEIFPHDLLPGWIQALAALSPFTWCLRLLRGAVSGGWRWSEAAGELAILGVETLLFVVLGLAALAWALRRVRRNGTLGQY